MAQPTYCRTCLSKQDLSPIFVNEEGAENRSRDLFLVTGVMIVKGDDFSQYVCNLCTYLINDALKLRSNSQKADQILKRSVQKKRNPQKATPKKDPNRKPRTIRKKVNKKNDTEETSSKQKEIVVHEFTEVKIKKEKTAEDDDDKSNAKGENKSQDNSDTSKSDNVVKHKIKCEIDIEFERSDGNSDNANLTVKSEKADSNKVVKKKPMRMSKAEIEQLMSLAVQPVEKAGPVRCSLCNTVVKLRSFLNHAKTHFAADHACEDCGKRYTNPNTLNYHRKRKHSTVRRFGCSLCPYRAFDRGTLLNHTRSAHTGERPFVCHECGDTFMMKATLIQHMRKHFGRYDVQCERCAGVFRSKSCLASHMNKVHLIRYTYYCYLCPSTYRKPGTVRNHLVKVHGVPRDQQPRIKCTKTRRQSNDEQAS